VKKETLMEKINFKNTEETVEAEQEETELIDVKMLNRSVLITHLNEEFYSWYKNVCADPESMDDVLDTPHTFLIPPVEDEEEVEDYIAENFFVIFEALLEEFIEDEDLLVEALTEENFDNWVDYNFSTFVMDAASDYELAYEDDEIIATDEETEPAT
jgi:hypothetical protein